MTEHANNSHRKQGKKAIWIIALILFGICCIVFIRYAYAYQLGWTGFNASRGPNVRQYRPAKTLWDWLQLLIVPAVLALVVYWLNHVNSHVERRMSMQRDETERAIALDNQRTQLFQDYLDRMSNLLLEQKFLSPQTHDEARNIARACTLTILPLLDAERKGRLLLFLYESQLITKNTPNCILLRNADFRGADLRGFDLSGANLNGANLFGAKLGRANLSESQLQNICLCEADLSGAILRSANLYEADLSRTILNSASLEEAKLMRANLSDAWLARTDATNADFSEATTSGIKLNQTIFNGATISQSQRSKMQVL